ncbi:MAG: hypothetical protein WB952_05900 [Terriglobales bacterium]
MRKLLETRRLFVVILALGLFIMAARSVTDPDVWWHLRTGQLILESHKVPHSDPYSFTKFGQPWIDHEWLSQILIFGLYRLAGWGGLITGFAAIIAAAYLMVFLRVRGRPFIAGAITVWGAVASIPCWGVRPQMLTLLLASAFLLILERSDQSPKVLWWTPPLMLLWVNLHAGFAVGLAFLALFLLGDWLDAAFGRAEKLLAPRLRRLALVTAACVAVVPLNPYSIRLYRYPFETLHSRTMQAYISEWHSPDFHQGRYLALLLMMLATLVLPALSPGRLRARDLLLLSVTMYAALRSARHLPVYVLVAVPLLSGLIQHKLEEIGKSQLFAGVSSLTRTKVVINSILLTGVLVFTALQLGHVIRHQSANEAREFPSAATSFLARTRPSGPLLNHYNWGGYFIWKLYPAYPVFIDGRADLYGDASMDEFFATYSLVGRSWRVPLEKWGIRTVVLPPDAPLVAALKTIPGWTQVFADSQATVLIKPK